MLSSEYINVAYKHLSSCMSLLLAHSKNGSSRYETNVLLELWYLAGYVLEGITVYFIYKNDDWDEQDDIKDIYNRAFSLNTRVDYYRNRYISEGRIFKQDKNTTCLSEDKQYFGPHAYNIHSHGFQSIVKDKFRVDARFDNLPYFGNSIRVDADVEYLIDNWNPKVRYAYFDGTQFKCEGTSVPQLNQDVIKRLLSNCYDIYSKILLVA